MDDALRRLVLGSEIPPKLLRDLGRAGFVAEGSLNVHTNRLGGGLTKEEKLVLSLTAHGLTGPMVAEVLGKSKHTVKKQLRSARYNLGAKNTTHAVAIAIRRGLIRF